MIRTFLWPIDLVLLDLLSDPWTDIRNLRKEVLKHTAFTLGVTGALWGLLVVALLVAANVDLYLIIPGGKWVLALLCYLVGATIAAVDESESTHARSSPLVSQMMLTMLLGAAFGTLLH